MKLFSVSLPWHKVSRKVWNLHSWVIEHFKNHVVANAVALFVVSVAFALAATGVILVAMGHVYAAVLPFALLSILD